MTEPACMSLKVWLEHHFNSQNLCLNALSGDAGFRRYFRLIHQGKSYIAVDSPPDKINNLAFVTLANALKKQGLNTPKLVAFDLKLGFFCLEDFGQTLLSDVLDEKSFQQRYRQAFALLPALAGVNTKPEYQLPLYDRALLTTEVNIFVEWLLEAHLGLTITEQQRTMFAHSFAFLIESALAQPRVTVHRDYHSRNLMVLSDDSIGVIDFQDAVEGPITYDIVSLLRDCYVCWPDELVYPLLEEYRQLLVAHQLIAPDCSDEFVRWFDLMGMQRHIKASGIFARLWHRDGKNGYLKDIPLTLTYVAHVGAKYPQTQQLAHFVKDVVLPLVNAKVSSKAKENVHERVQ